MRTKRTRQATPSIILRPPGERGPAIGMSSFVFAPLVMAGLGLFFAVILALAYRFLKVQEDPLVEQTEELLPGSNCGACGQPGCHAFAEQLVAGAARPASARSHRTIR